MEDAPAFFNPIVRPVHLKKLRIPAGFTKEYESTVSSDHVYIQAPGGLEYKVGLMKRANKVWLTDGWKEFAQNYLLAYGHFLVFRYQGNSRFNIHIYDDSSCEIDYHNLDSQSSDEDEDESSSFVEDGVDLGKGDVKLSRVYEEAEAFQCGTPSFIVAMNNSYIKNDSRLWIPMRHAKKWLKEVGSVVLERANPKGGPWIVRVTRANECFRFGGGWPSFVRANWLEVGDVCKFELVKTHSYRVHIFRHD